MPIFMDRHFIEGATHHAISNAHEKDLKTQNKHGVKFLPTDAVACGIEIQKKFKDHNRTGSDQDLYVRIGISAGEPIEDHGDLFGSAVQLAARLCGFADPEQIVVSEFIADHYEGLETLLDIGEVSLKGFRQPVQAYSVNC